MNNTEKQSFKKEIIERISKKLGGSDNVEVRIQQVYKTNITLDSITIMDRTKPEVNMTPSIYLNSYYQDFDMGIDIDDIATKIIEVYEENKVVEPFEVAKLTNYDSVKDRICCKAISKKLNEEMLLDIPHDEVLDLAVCFYIVLGSDINGTMASVLIHNSLMETWGITEQELSELAHKNTPKLLGVSIQEMREVLRDMLIKDMQKNLGSVFSDEEMDEFMAQTEVTGNMYILTNDDKYNGAVLMTFPEILKEFAVKHNREKLIILPSSIHETIILLDDTGDYSCLDEMVMQVNESQVAENEILSNHAYLFSVKDSKLTMI